MRLELVQLANDLFAVVGKHTFYFLQFLFDSLATCGAVQSPGNLIEVEKVLIMGQMDSGQTELASLLPLELALSVETEAHTMKL
jgi:hypothetical protein